MRLREDTMILEVCVRCGCNIKDNDGNYCYCCAKKLLKLSPNDMRFNLKEMLLEQIFVPRKFLFNLIFFTVSGFILYCSYNV